MGEVYRAQDTRLCRDVALKVLPELFARDAERMARFEREAKVLASLNHPKIASIYGLEEWNGARALVMELVEGPTLAERIRQGPLPLDDALPFAQQIAEGLEYAHERGIIHRDLKPSNVKLTPESQVKLLDFGLAKALEAETTEGELQNSPTLSAAATRAGVLLGTARYMSPEQARGKRMDRRADIWAFGCVLYEMLSGLSAFSGETTSDILASVFAPSLTGRLYPIPFRRASANSCTAAYRRMHSGVCATSVTPVSPSRKPSPVPFRPRLYPPLHPCARFDAPACCGLCWRWDLFSQRSVLGSSRGIYTWLPGGARSAVSHSLSLPRGIGRLRRKASHCEIFRRSQSLRMAPGSLSWEHAAKQRRFFFEHSTDWNRSLYQARPMPPARSSRQMASGSGSSRMAS
jgi:serine/threonine protein kinase